MGQWLWGGEEGPRVPSLAIQHGKTRYQLRDVNKLRLPWSLLSQTQCKGLTEELLAKAEFKLLQGDSWLLFGLDALFLAGMHLTPSSDAGLLRGHR